MFINKYLILLVVFFISACTIPPKVTQLPPQKIPSQTFRIKQQQPAQQQSLLVVQFLPNQWRWIQTDPLGAPLARLILTQQGWQNDGFVMPNAQAELLFSALANYLNPIQPPFRVDSGKFPWTTRPQAKGVAIRLVDQSQWYIEEIK